MKEDDETGADDDEASNLLSSQDFTAEFILLQSRIKSPLAGPSFVLARAGSRRRVVHIKAFEKDSLIPLYERRRMTRRVRTMMRRATSSPRNISSKF